VKKPNNTDGGARLVFQSFPTSDLDDLFQNVLRTTMAFEGLAYLRYAEWRSEVAFEAATAREYLQPGDEVLADMRDDCDLRRTVKREGNLIQLLPVRNTTGSPRSWPAMIWSPSKLASGSIAHCLSLLRAARSPSSRA